MASSRANSDQSAPLMSQDGQPGTAVGFQQQGTVDWTRVMSGSVTFSVDVLSRLSKAGVEAFTIYAARAIFSNVKLGRNGEMRLHSALDKLSAFPSFGKALWFGFGVKHIIWSMQESAEGLNCLGICACLIEGYSTYAAAKIIRELFLLYNPPAELTPALRQWVALVETSGGLLASSEFGLVLHGLTKLCLMEDLPRLPSPGSPRDVAFVLKEIFEVSVGRLDRLFLSGGADCAWIAAVAHWLLDLRVEVQDENGTIVYRPDGRPTESLRVSRKHYLIAAGETLFDHSHGNQMSCGRVPWKTCLVDTFGSHMRLLLGSQARSTGACLGSAARIFLANLADGEGYTEFSLTPRSEQCFPPISESSYGRGFFVFACRLLPELGQNPVLHKAMEEALNTGLPDAAERFSQSYTSLSQLCPCMDCRPNAQETKGGTVFCLLTLILTICTLVRAMSTINMQRDLQLQPTRSGLESLYWSQAIAISREGGIEHDPVQGGLLGRWPVPILDLAQTLFAGRGHDKAPDHDIVTAVSHSGLCSYRNTLTEITSDPQRACVVTVVPGRIAWNDFIYDMVRDLEPESPTLVRGPGYDAVSMTNVTKYDDLADSSTPGLGAKLDIEEVFPEGNSLSVMYRVSTTAFPGRHFSIGASEIWQKLNSAFTAASCDGKTCGSINGFQSILVKGEGLLPMMSDWGRTPLPLTRVLSARDISVWVALSQSYIQPSAAFPDDLNKAQGQG
ncbi:hypothetical protein FPCIR_1773 [Fusarium pseudocircinatum]|uniref:Uncharacterized protein n=1 Tax=Fusarium pseudocircinatum TaxID=56676 RepID=A0A8H5PU45_9HYPO|nr:hypothetical protein FPCIR_1773 [Fusarium pseudocircinatum]